jgi:predicted nucleic acid-binding protein
MTLEETAMTLEEISQALSLEVLARPREPGVPVTRAHASDLLSDVLANAPAGGLLLTLQVHLNVVAVAVHAGLAGVVFTSGMRPDQAVLARAADEQLALFATRDSTFEAAGRLYGLGIRGAHG